ncbi:hypothetical protein [uncultured Sphingomonas sp.]|uniref:hypothetical protein n=1 Tax=uncultured Sphingomonas sp. TaxID=158754 RepID=UPI0025F250A5|nr:hypothetical protein [uncultured Sphingomonas sp.]
MIETLARVARVIDEYTVVLNKGSADGVQRNDKFLIYGVGEDVIDPDTGESLGALEMVRGTVRVEHLQERVCTVRSNQTIKIPGRKRTIERKPGGSLSLALAMGTAAREEIEYDGSVEDKELEKPAVGDYARPY